MSNDPIKKILHNQGVHNIAHKLGHSALHHGIKHVQSPHFQRQLQQFGQSLLRIFR